MELVYSKVRYLKDEVGTLAARLGSKQSPVAPNLVLLYRRTNFGHVSVVDLHCCGCQVNFKRFWVSDIIALPVIPLFIVDFLGLPGHFGQLLCIISNIYDHELAS